MGIGAKKQYVCCSRDHIEEVVSEIKKLIREEARSMLGNRSKNEEFRKKYIMTVSEIFNEILNLEVNQFCHAFQDDRSKDAHKKDLLYVFEYIFDYGENVNIKVYLKFKIKELDGKRLLIFSFHEPEYPMEKRFN